MAVLIDGKALAAEIRADIAENIHTFTAAGHRKPCLAVILAGDNAASAVYVRNKKKDCDEVGITSLGFDFNSSVTRDELLKLIDRLNGDDSVDGILCQLPLPKGIDENEILAAISPSKDVDAFHPFSAGLIMQGKPMFLPCTPAGIMRMLEKYGIDPSGKECVIVGRSNIVGKPMAMLLLKKNGTVTVCHTKTPSLRSHTERADILIAAAGKAGLITGDMIKDGAVVIDVGMNRDENGLLCGDCDFSSCEKKASYITPVPGGVGPMTRAMLLVNTLASYKSRLGI